MKLENKEMTRAEAVEASIKESSEEVQATPEKKVAKIKKEKVLVEVNLDAKIKEWKKVFGSVYKNEMNGEAIIWRAIRRKEYRELLSVEEDMTAEERLLLKQEKTVLMAVLYPSNIEVLIEEKAGFATVLSEEILSKSGFEITETESL